MAERLGVFRHVGFFLFSARFGASGHGDLSARSPIPADRGKATDFPATSPWRLGGDISPAFLPVLHPNLPHHPGDAAPARIMELPLDSMGNEQFARLCSERKERVRQIQRGAMGKLRTAAEEDRIE